MTTPEEFFDDIDPINTPDEEIGALIHHGKALAMLLECAAEHAAFSLSAPEAWHLLMSLTHRAGRVRYAIASREEEVTDGLADAAQRITNLREAIYESRPVPMDDAGFTAWWKKLTGEGQVKKAA